MTARIISFLLAVVVSFSMGIGVCQFFAVDAASSVSVLDGIGLRASDMNRLAQAMGLNQCDGWLPAEQGGLIAPVIEYWTMVAHECRRTP